MTTGKIDLPFRSIGQLTALFEAGDVSPVEATEQCLRQIERHNDKINAFTRINADGARHLATESEKRWRSKEPIGPLDGVPFTVKDNLMVSGFPFRRGSLVTPVRPVNENAPIVARCREAGGVFIGLTTMPEFGVGPVTISPLTGITRNPWDITKQSGGSSGGAAAGLAAGFCNFAIGSDAGGSIRIPAALTGVIGLKPSAGRVPMYPSASSLSCNGPMTRTVRDAALILSLANQRDSRDGTADFAVGNDFTGNIGDGISGLKFAASKTLGYAQLVDPEVITAFERATGVFANLGASVVNEDPVIEDPIGTYLTLLRAGYQYALRNVTAAEKAHLSVAVREILYEIKSVTTAEYLQAIEKCQAYARYFHEFLGRYDGLLTPTVAAPAFAAGRSYPENYEPFPNRRAWVPFTAIFNLTGQPAMNLPIGLTSKGLPIGLQLVGARGAEATILRAAAAFEEAAGFRERPKLIG